jgi:hypothetical protein
VAVFIWEAKIGSKYTTIAVAGFNANPPADDGSQTEANKVTWAKIKTKLGDPLNTAIEAIDDALVEALDTAVSQVGSAYTTVASDHLQTIEVASTASSAVQVSLGDAATMGNGYTVRIKNSSSHLVTIGRATGGDTIDGVAFNRVLVSGQSATVIVNSGATGYLIVASTPSAWVTPTFAAGDFTAGGAMTWTVASGDVTTYAYRLDGKTMTVVFHIATSSVSGGDFRLQIAIPASRTAAKRISNPILANDNGSFAIGYCEVAASGAVITCFKSPSATNWSASTDASAVQGQITFEVV